MTAERTRLSVRLPKWKSGTNTHTDGSWFCPPTVEVLEDAGLQTIDEYINRRRQTVRILRGTDRFMRLADNRRLCRPTSTKQFGGSWKYDLFYIF